jgi:hypothetical protein
MKTKVDRPTREVTCPTCGAQPGEPCRTLTTGARSADSHVARVNARWGRPEVQP